MSSNELKNSNEAPKENDSPSEMVEKASEDISKIENSDGNAEIEVVTSEMPQVVHDAVNAAQEKEESIEKENIAAVDKKGRAFDPAIHATDSNGKPLYTPTGRFRTLRRPAGLNSPTQTARVDTSDQNAKATAIVAVTGGNQCLMMMFGEEWAFEKSKDMDEKEYLTQLTYEYFKAKGVVDIPPGVMLCIGLSMYAAKRITKPTTARIVGGFVGKVKNAVGKLFVRRQKAPERKENE